MKSLNFGSNSITVESLTVFYDGDSDGGAEVMTVCYWWPPYGNAVTTTGGGGRTATWRRKRAQVP